MPPPEKKIQWHHLDCLPLRSRSLLLLLPQHRLVGLILARYYFQHLLLQLEDLFQYVVQRGHGGYLEGLVAQRPGAGGKIFAQRTGMHRANHAAQPLDVAHHPQALFC